MELAEKFPDEVIGWCEEAFQGNLAIEEWNRIFHHNLIMASYAVKTSFLPESIGYIDQLPFVNVNREVYYPTWQMSSDMGGITGKVLLRFKYLFEKISSFEYLLNSLAKTGQQNGLFCYSNPALTNEDIIANPVPGASFGQLFSFVFQHYTNFWTSVLLWCLWKHEKKFPFAAYLKSFSRDKMFGAEVDLSAFTPALSEKNNESSIDVIIPTLSRKEYLHQMLEDLKAQTFLPKNVIIVEQNPERGTQSQLADIIRNQWPFEIIHHFIHKTGACNARNLAINEVQSEWIFFADDDIRLQPDLVKKAMEEVMRYQISAVNINCKQPGEETVFHKVKQWGSFGAGTSIVKSSFAQQCRFSKVFEYGFGEDADFGMQLRNNGSDIIYHPQLQILHLKAPTGGFRKKQVLPWEQGKSLPKPSPTLMAYAMKHYTPEQLNGYKISLFLKFYGRQREKNPVKYLRQMRKRWKISEEWANMILQKG